MEKPAEDQILKAREPINWNLTVGIQENEGNNKKKSQWKVSRKMTLKLNLKKKKSIKHCALGVQDRLKFDQKSDE